MCKIYATLTDRLIHTITTSETDIREIKATIEDVNDFNKASEIIYIINIILNYVAYDSYYIKCK